MPRGAPDYSNVRGGSLFGRVDDLGELIGRLGYAPGIDRLGRIVFYQDFRYGSGALETVSKGLGEEMSLSATYSLYGGFTYKLTRVADTESWSSFGIYSLIVESGRLSLEAQFCVMGSDPNLKFYIARYTGTERKLWGLRWDAVLDKIYIGGDTIGWTEIASGYDIFVGVPHYHNIKFVVDVDDENYVRVLIDGKPIPVVEKASQDDPSPNSPHIVINIYNGKDPSTASELYVDYVMVKMDEP